MSETYELCCVDCKEYLWIGQGHATTLYVYSADDDTMQYLNEFLRKHLSTLPEHQEYENEQYKHHHLVFLETQDVPDDWKEDERVYKDRNVNDDED